jgi:hypothetical protein
MIAEKNHILKILENTKYALEKKDYIIIKNLSNKAVHQSSIDQDPDVVAITVIVYSLGKLIENENYKKEKNWNNFYRAYLKNINDMIKALKKEDIKKFRNEVNENRKLIQGLSGKLKDYISEVFRKAKINKASKIYEHGISMEKTAKVLGITVWELAEYAGNKGIGGQNLAVTMPIKERVKLAQDIFNE